MGLIHTSGRPLGYRELSVLTSAAVGLDDSVDPADSTKTGVPRGSQYALIYFDQACRWRDDGTAPTSSQGFPQASTDVLNYDGQLSVISFIAQTTVGTARISFYGVS